MYEMTTLYFVLLSMWLTHIRLIYWYYKHAGKGGRRGAEELDSTESTSCLTLKMDSPSLCKQELFLI